MQDICGWILLLKQWTQIFRLNDRIRSRTALHRIEVQVLAGRTQLAKYDALTPSVNPCNKKDLGGVLLS